MPGDDDKIKESDTLHKFGMDYLKVADMTMDVDAKGFPKKI
jgi:hypothetical protein